MVFGTYRSTWTLRVLKWRPLYNQNRSLGYSLGCFGFMVWGFEALHPMTDNTTALRAGCRCTAGARPSSAYDLGFSALGFFRLLWGSLKFNFAEFISHQRQGIISSPKVPSGLIQLVKAFSGVWGLSSKVQGFRVCGFRLLTVWSGC